MLGQRKVILFKSPRGDGEPVRIQVKEGVPMTLAGAIAGYEQQTGFHHEQKDYHFSLDAKEITNPNTPLVFVSGAAIVASYAKVGGNN